MEELGESSFQLDYVFKLVAAKYLLKYALHDSRDMKPPAPLPMLSSKQMLALCFS